MATPTQKRLIQKRLTDIRKAKNTPWSKRFKWTGFSGKTLWDWLNLLGVFLIPIVVVGATIGFGWWQVHLADVQHQQDQQHAQDQQREAALQAYLDRMSDLLINNKLHELKSVGEVQVVGRARTLTLLSRLDPGRKVAVLVFLDEADLITAGNAIVALGGADLSGIDIDFSNLVNIDLSQANLRRSHFSGSDLSGSDLSSADLSGAAINYANLSKVNLSGADLFGDSLGITDLSGASLSKANFGDAILYRDKFVRADLHETNLDGADLRGSDLSRANLSGATLFQANLSRASYDHREVDLSGTDLRGADLTQANLLGAKVTKEQLAKAKSLKGATMPDGSIHP